jgi:NAD(P)-dependent dehydrogenase (short-subunit alcohol dehydrogenase family)
MPFAEKVYTVTGGARGIGFAVARYLAERRATVCIADILHEDLLKAEKQLQSDFPHVSILRKELDISNGTDVEEWLDNIKVGLGRLDGCVNNAGMLDLSKRGKLGGR